MTKIIQNTKDSAIHIIVHKFLCVFSSNPSCFFGDIDAYFIAVRIKIIMFKIKKSTIIVFCKNG